MSGGPEVSVVVATHDRAQRLGLLLDALRAQSLETERFEVVVVDDASPPDTAALLDRESSSRGGCHSEFCAETRTAGGPRLVRTVGGPRRAA